jgi:hypothetical protein
VSDPGLTVSASDITCSGCLSRLGAMPLPDLVQHYGLGRPTAPEAGHALFFGGLGTVALCMARQRASRFVRG